MRGRFWLTAVWATVAVLLVGCGDGGGDSASTTASQTSTGESTPEASSNTLAFAAGPLKDAGFSAVKTTSFKQGGVRAVGSLEASRSAAHFYAAQFQSAAEAKIAGAQFAQIDKRAGLPFEISGATLIYTTKCCVDSGPKPVIPKADFEAFKSALSQ